MAENEGRNFKGLNDFREYVNGLSSCKEYFECSNLKELPVDCIGYFPMKDGVVNRAIFLKKGDYLCCDEDRVEMCDFKSNFNGQKVDFKEQGKLEVLCAEGHIFVFEFKELKQ